jgi:pimeloyl-ACP methyl ester carboxylesterase
MLREISIALIAVLLLAGLILALNYQSDISKAQERIRKGHIIETACGPIEYSTEGEGPNVLVVHGAGGGFDQGLWFANVRMSKEFHIIAPSRFGYLGTPLPTNASPVEQADAYACLLDALKIDKAAVVGGSAGAFSSMQFALRHPDRVSSLVLIVPAAWAPASNTTTQEVASSNFILDVVLRSDPIFWFFTKIGRSDMISFFGVSKEAQSRITPEDDKRISELIDNLLPVSRRVDGMVNDGINHAKRERYPLENISVPTLVIDAADVGTYAGSKYTAENIPEARFIEFETGGHLLIGHEEEVRKVVTEFLKGHFAN